MASARKRALWIVPFALAAVLLYYSLRGIEWARVWEAIRNARPGGLALAISITSVSLFLRAARWRVLLQAEGRVSLALAFQATCAGYLGNNFLPARAGEVVRTVMIGARTGMSKTFVLTTALLERIADALVLVTVSATILLTVRGGPGWLGKAATPFGILGIVGVAALICIPAFESVWIGLLHRLPVPHGIRDKSEQALRHVLQGMRTFHHAGRLGRFLAFTPVIWCMDVATALAVAHAMSLSVPVPAAFLLIAGLGLGSALPSTPGYAGIYQFAAVSVLTPFGVSRAGAIACILVLQALNYIVLLVLGGFALGRQRFNRPAPAEVTPAVLT